MEVANKMLANPRSEDINALVKLGPDPQYPTVGESSPTTAIQNMSARLIIWSLPKELE
jgi:hypothetical protein